MVAIVSGNSLGLNLTSLGVLGDRGVFGNSTLGKGGDQIFVNVANGNLVLRNLDDRLAGVGGIFGSVRTYNSQGNFGHSDAWSLGTALKKVRLQGTINTAGSLMYRQDDDGSEQTYRYDATLKLYVSMDGGGAMDTLAREASTGQYVWTDGDTGIVERYEGSGAGRLLSTTDTSGNKQLYAYGANGKIASVTDASGGVTFYDYSGNNLTQIRTATTENGQQVIQTRIRYSYDTLGRLSAVAVDLSPKDNSIADGKVFQTFYTYDGNSDRLATISQTDGTQMSFGYELVDGQYRVTQVVDALGRTTRYGYVAGQSQSYMIDAQNQTTRFFYDAQGNLVQVQQPAVNGASATTKYSYDADGNVTRIEEANGLTVDYTYDARGNRTQSLDSAGNLVKRSFDAQNRLLTETLYTVPATGTVPASGAQTRRYVYDTAGRLRFELTPEGRVTEYRYTSTGLRASTLTYAGNSYSVSSLAETALPTLAQLTTWAAAADMSRVQRVDASYDYRGQLQQTIAYANVTSTGVGITDGMQILTRYVYDQTGRLLSTVSPTGGATSYTYDGLGRVLSVQDAEGNVTLTQYDDAGNSILVSQSNGLKTLSIFDAAGRRISVQQQTAAGAGLGETKYAYDANDRLIMSTDPTNARSFTLYDAAGRKTADINHLGFITHYIYNSAGQLTATRRYSKAVSPNLLVNAQGVALNPDVSSLIPAGAVVTETRNFYDASGRLALIIDASGSVRQFFFDGAGRQTKEVAYATRVNLAGIPAAAGLADVPVVTSANDAIAYRFYTADGLLQATVDAEGGAVEYVYDSAGRQVQRTGYLTKVNAAKLATATSFETLRPVKNAKDVNEFWLFNNQGRAVGYVSAENYLTESVYDAAGNLTTQVRYTTAVAGVTLASQLTALRPSPAASDRVVTYTYTRLNQVSSERDAEGNLTLYVYDSMGKRTSTVRAAESTAARSVLTRYDLLGRVIGELSGEGAAKITGNQTQAEVDAIWKSHGVQYTYDLAGRRTSSIDAAGARTLYYYDLAGRLSYTINSLGYVEGRVYDNLDQLLEISRIATPISLTGLSGGILTNAIQAKITAALNTQNDLKTSYSYTADGRVRSETDATGGVIEHSYDAFGNEVLRLTTLAGAIKRTDTFSYDRKGQQLTSVLDSTGIARTVSRSYDAFGREVSRIDALGNTTTTSYDRQGRVLSVKDAGGTRSSTYDAFDNVLTQTDELGRKTTYTYDLAARKVVRTSSGGVAVSTVHNEFGETVSVSDGRGTVTSYIYNADGSLLTQKVGSAVVETRSYDNANRVIKTTDGDGYSTTYTYDVLGRTLTETISEGTLNLSKQYRYDSFNRRYMEIDANGVQNAIEFDKAGRVVASIKDVAGLAITTRYTFDSAGRQVSVVSPTGMVTSYIYDALGQRLTEVKDSAGLKLTTSYSYDAAGNVTSRTEPSGAMTRMVLDHAGRVRFSIDAAGVVAETRYNAAGQVTAVLSYSNAISLAGLGQAVTAAQVTALLTPVPQDTAEYRYYDTSGRLAMQVSGLGQVTQIIYDKSDNVTERRVYVNRLAPALIGAAKMPAVPAASSNDQRERSYTDGFGRVIYRVDGTGAMQRFSYSVAGRLAAVVNYAGRVDPAIAMSVSVLNASLATFADAARDQVTNYYYDAAGRQQYAVDSLGGVTETKYDAAGQVIEQVRYANRVATRSKPATVVASANDIKTSIRYDGAGRVAAQTDANGNVTRFVRNASGDVLLQIDGTGAVSENRYDALGRLVQQTQYLARINASTLALVTTEAEVRALVSAGTADPTIYSYYGTDGRLAMTVNRIGVAVSYRYDTSGRLLERITYANLVPAASIGAASKPANPAVDLAHDQRDRHVYDNLGREIYTLDGTGAVTQQRYDSEGRVVERIAYATRVASNIALTGMAIEDALAAIADAQRDQRVISVYDGVGRLTHTLDGVGAVVENVYDAGGNRTRQIRYATQMVSGTDPKSITASSFDRTTDWVYDGAGRTIVTVDATGAVTRSIFDANGNAIQQFAYATPLADGVPRTGDAILAALTASATDRVTTTVFDAANRAVLQIDAEQGVTRNRYDAAGNLLETIRYSNRLSGSSLGGLAASALTEAALSTRLPAATVQDRSTRFFYDEAGRQVYKIDAGGFVTQTDYDAVGRKVATRAYFNGLGTTAFASTAAVGAALVVNTTFDRAESFVYDAAGRLLGMTDALNNSESYTYDGVGNRRSFTNKIAKKWLYDFDAAGRLIKETAPAVAVSTTTMDAAGNLVLSAPVNVAIVTRNEYDALGNLVARIEADGRPESRTTRYVFDAAGRQIRTLNAPVAVYDAQADNLLTNGSAGGATRSEQQNVSLSSDVLYNVFGEAVAGRNVSGVVSYKIYDKTGAVKYEVDAEGYVTQYDRDALGNVVLKMRYAQKTALATGAFAGLSGETVRAAVNAQGVNHAADRSITTQYDRLGQAVEITGSQIFAYDSSATTSAQYFNSSQISRKEYDAFGQVVAVRDLVNPVSDIWATSTTYYDKLGNVTAKVDPLGYVTTYSYDAYGNKLSAREYLKPTTQWSATGFALPATDVNDRVTQYTYDLRGLLATETRVSVEIGAANGTVARGNSVTSYGYNAIGNQTRMTAADGGITYTYYDALGRVSAIVDPARSGAVSGVAMRPLTTFAYDAAGNRVSVKQHAGGATSVTNNSYTAVNGADDRSTLTRFDSRGNVIQTTDANGKTINTSYNAAGQVAKQWRDVKGNDGSVKTWFQAYEYDRLGQQTRVIDPASTAVLSSGITTSISSSQKTYMAYGDVMKGTNSVRLNWSSLTDSAGGLVRVQIYYNTVSTLREVETGNEGGGEGGYGTGGVKQYTGKASVATSRTVDFGAAQASGGATVSWYDDKVVQGGISSLSFVRIWQQDAAGNWISKWEGNPAQATGSGVIDVSQAQAGWSDTVTEYNAFGEVVTRGVDGGQQEYYEYDNAGNVIRSNANKGVDEIRLYNLQSKATSTLQSAGKAGGDINVRNIASAQDAALMSNLRRNDVVYDVNGNALEARAPARTTMEGGVAVSQDYTRATINQTATLTYLPDQYGEGGSNAPVGEGGVGPVDEDGNPTGIPAFVGTNQVTFQWTSLAALGDGDVRVVFKYQSSGGTVHEKSGTYTGAQAASTVTFTWDGKLTNTKDGGVSRIVSLVVYKKDVTGAWQPVINQDDRFGYTGNFIDVAAPADPGIKMRMDIRQGTGAWTTVNLVNYGNTYRYDTEGLAAGAYEYRVSHVARDGTVTQKGSGTLNLASPTLTAISSTPNFTAVSGEVLSWASYGDNVDAQFRYRAQGGSAWTSMTVAARGNGRDGVAWSGIGAGTYEYELVLVNKTTGAAYAHVTGAVTKVAAVPAQYVPPVGIPPIKESLSLNTGNTAISWSPSAYADNTGTAVLRYRLIGASAWSSVTMAKTAIGTGEAGEGGEAGSSLYTYSVAFGTLAAGEYEFDLLYTPAGASSPSKHKIGTISQGATTPGYYYTRTYTVQVPVRTWIPPTYNSEGGETGGGYWQVTYRTETRSEQVWVPAVVPRPGMSQANATYVAGYTIPAKPAAYSVSNTTSSNPRAISVSGSGALGIKATWAAVGQNGGSTTETPSVFRSFDRYGNVLSVTDPRSPYWVTRYTYNADNQLTSESRPNENGNGIGAINKLYYDKMGRNVASVDANGNRTSMAYDAAGNRTTETHADGGVFKYEYNQFGEKTVWVDALGNQTTYSYDKLGRIVLTSHAAVDIWSVGSDNVSVTKTGTTTVTEAVTYDELGNKLSSTNGMGEVTQFRYDLRGNVTGVRKPGMSTELRTAYDARGNKTFEADGNGYASTWKYDYFGMLIGHADIGGAVYTYTYDGARQLLSQTNTRGQSMAYTYDVVGRVTTIRDNALGSVTSYSYDHAGNKVRERTEQGGVVYQNNIMAYDAAGRLREVSDNYLRQSITYDANGNRTRVQTTYTDAGNTSRNRDYWYGYDAMNRQTTVEGINAALDINATQGHKLTYDLNGNRLSDRYWDKTIAADGSTAAGYTTETYRYDILNRLTGIVRDGSVIDSRLYDGADRVVQSGIDGSKAKSFFDKSGLVNEQRRNRYDAAGRLINARTLSMGTAGLGSKFNTAYTGYDQAGNVTGYQLQVWEGKAYVNTYTYTHARYEGYRESTLSGTSTYLDPGTTTYNYDVNGNLIRVTDAKDSTRNQTLVNDVSGKILQRVQNGQTIRSLVVNGELMGTTGPAVGADDFSPSYRPIDGGNPSASPGSYRIQAGDTLQSIAQQAYGDSRLWYLIAESNGMASDRDLRVGATVTIPNRVSGNHNDFQTFKPYDPGKLIGDTQPTMPVPAPKGGGGCGGFGMILTMVVAVVATVFTAGTLAPLVATAASVAGMGTMAAGATLLTGGLAAGALGAAGLVGAAVVAGAVGSVVSQGVGMAVGAQSKFSWSGVALSGIAAGVTSGVGGMLGKEGILAGIRPENVYAQAAMRGAIGSSLTQGVAVATGLQSKFSWTGVAAAGVGAAVGAWAGESIQIKGWDFGTDLTRGFVAGAAGAATASALGGGKVNTFQVALDAFGNALANSAIKEISVNAGPSLDERRQSLRNDAVNRMLAQGFSSEQIAAFQAQPIFESLIANGAKMAADTDEFDRRSAPSEPWRGVPAPSQSVGIDGVTELPTVVVTGREISNELIEFLGSRLIDPAMGASRAVAAFAESHQTMALMATTTFQVATLGPAKAVMNTIGDHIVDAAIGEDVQKIKDRVQESATEILNTIDGLRGGRAEFLGSGAPILVDVALSSAGGVLKSIGERWSPAGVRNVVSSGHGKERLVEVEPRDPNIRFYVATDGQTLDSDTFRRNTGYRNNVRQDTWNANVENGVVRDPLTQKVMNPGEPFDMGHRPQMEYHKERAHATNNWLYNRKETSRKEFLDIMNDSRRYRPELPSSNRSHAGEDKSNILIKWDE